MGSNPSKPLASEEDDQPWAHQPWLPVGRLSLQLTPLGSFLSYWNTPQVTPKDILGDLSQAGPQ